MPKYQRSFARRALITAHKLILDRTVRPSLRQLNGRTLVVGAGLEDYSALISSTHELITTDIIMSPHTNSVADAHDLPFSDNSFDSYVAIEVFEHLQSPEKAATEIHRVLKPGAVAILSIPFLFRVHGDPSDFQRLTKSGLQVLFEDFTGVAIAEFGNRLHVISDLITTASKLLIPLRLLNHVFRLNWLNSPSTDAPSGYLVILRK